MVFPSRTLPARCSWAAVSRAVIAVPFAPLSIWEGAFVFPCTQPAGTRSKPSACSKTGECKSRIVSVPL